MYIYRVTPCPLQVEFRLLSTGACDGSIRPALRLLSRDECKRFAALNNYEHIGSSTEPTEYPG